jgi:hypothetical protein
LNEQEAGLGKFIKSWQEFSRKNAVLAPWFGAIQGGSAQSLMIMLLELEFALLKLAFMRTNMPYIGFK